MQTSKQEYKEIAVIILVLLLIPLQLLLLQVQAIVHKTILSIGNAKVFKLAFDFRV